MQLIALTGGIASGKSTVGRRLAALGAVRIDADELAREAVAPGSPGLNRVIERFGSQLLDSSGALDRAALGGIVFGDQAALADLNAIVHPEVRRLGQEQISAAVARDGNAVVVYEIPLLVETGGRSSASGFDWDLVVVADAPSETRLERMIALRGMDEQEARRRLANQAGDAERRKIADVIIDTSGTEDHTLEQVDALWKRLSASQ
ncbi:dephospho-CoA kinase [Leucobacter sp. BZR 635]